MKKYEKMLICIITTSMVVTLFIMIIFAKIPLGMKWKERISNGNYFDSLLMDAELDQNNYGSSVERLEEEIKLKINNIDVKDVSIEEMQSKLDGQVSNNFAYTYTTIGQYVYCALAYELYFLLTIIGGVTGYFIYLIFIEKRKLTRMIIPFLVCAIIFVIVDNVFLRFSFLPYDVTFESLILFVGLCAFIYVGNMIYCKIIEFKLNRELNKKLDKED